MSASLPPLIRRILSRLASALAQELDPWIRDDLKIAHRIVVHAARGDATICGPHVLASYEVLGLHPEKVWPSILARRDALGPLTAAPPKKPPQSVKLWSEKTNAARVQGSRRVQYEHGSPRTSISVLMATRPIGELYPNSDAPSSAKKRPLTYDEMLKYVRKSFAPASVVEATINALTARGRWPNQDGPVDGVLCVSLNGMMLGGEDGGRNVVRSTARWRARQAVKHGYWRLLRKPNSWSNCPKCGAERRKHAVDCKCGNCPPHAGTCEKCGYEGHARTPEGKANFEEFCRPYMYEIDIEKFRHALPAKGIRHFNHRSYQEHKAAAKRGEHPNVVSIEQEMPSRKPTQPAPEPPPPPATVAPLKRPAAEHPHRSPDRRLPSLTSRQRSELVQRIPVFMKGRAGSCGMRWFSPGDPDYREPMSKRAAILAACKSMCEGDERYGFRAQGVSMEKALEAAADAGFKVDPESS